MPLSDEERKARKQESSRKSYQRNKARVIARSADWATRNPEARLRITRNWRKNHPKPKRTPLSDEERKARRRAKNARYREKHRQELRLKQRAYLDANRNAIKAKKRDRYHARTEEERAQDRAKNTRYRTAKHDQVRARINTWRRAHPESYVPDRHKRRIRLSNAQRKDLTREQYLLVITAAHGVCVYCQHYNPTCRLCPKGQHKLTIDHITPLARGGDHTLHNLVACCRSCNVKKYTHHVPIPVQPLLL